MGKKVKNLGKNVLPDGDYKLQFTDCKGVFKDGMAAPLGVIDFMVVGPSFNKDLFGKHMELAFSMSSESIVKSWVLALGIDEEEELPDEIFTDPDALEGWLRTHCNGAVVMAKVSKVNRKGYDNNEVDKPWENIGPSQLSEGDHQDSDIPF